MPDTIDLHLADTIRRRSEAAARCDDRMAELVAELTGCPRSGALHALREQDGSEVDPLALVARAMITVGRPSPLREPGYLCAG